MARMVGAIALVAALTLGSTAAPVGAHPSDVHSAWNTVSDQYDLGGCLYKVMWGNFSSWPYAVVHVYNLTACSGGVLVAIQYDPGTGVVATNSTTVTATGSDGCGSYKVIQATAPVTSIAVRAFVSAGAQGRWYDTDGTADQADIEC